MKRNYSWQHLVREVHAVVFVYRGISRVYHSAWLCVSKCLIMFDEWMLNEHSPWKHHIVCALFFFFFNFWTEINKNISGVVFSVVWPLFISNSVSSILFKLCIVSNYYRLSWLWQSISLWLCVKEIAPFFFWYGFPLSKMRHLLIHFRIGMKEIVFSPNY